MSMLLTSNIIWNRENCKGWTFKIKTCARDSGYRKLDKSYYNYIVPQQNKSPPPLSYKSNERDGGFV